MRNHIDTLQGSLTSAVVASQARALAVHRGRYPAPAADDYATYLSRLVKKATTIVSLLSRRLQRTSSSPERPPLKRALVHGKVVTFTPEQAARFEELQRLRAVSCQWVDGADCHLSAGRQTCKN